MNSHILIPKCILKNFQDEKHSLHCYDVVNNTYCLKRAENLFTEYNHYSLEVEQFLSDKIESPIGQVIKKIKNCYLSENFLITAKECCDIKNYAYSLISRSKEIKNEIYKKLIFKNCLSKQNLNDICATESFELVKQEDPLKNFHLTFMFVEEDAELVLPLQGHCDLSDGAGSIYLFPVTPKIAIYFYNGKKLNNTIIRANNELCNQINIISFNAQKKKNYGFVISRREKNIKDLIVSMQ